MKKDKVVIDIINKIDKSSDSMSRRDALKFLGISPIAASVIAGTTAGALDASASTDKKVKIVIVGGGTGGIISAVRLSRAASNAEITLIAPNETHLYQPGQVFMAAGLYVEDDIKKDNADFIPSNVKWIKDSVSQFVPDNNYVVTKERTRVEYDYLVVATGLEYNYAGIEGMSEELVGQKGISSVYLSDAVEGTARGGTATWQWFQDVRKAAAQATETNPVKVIYTQPDTAIKCGGAPQKMLYLSADYLRGNGPGGGENLGKNAQLTFCKPGSTLFSLPEYNKVLVEEVTAMYGNITDKFEHVLRKIDAEKKIATFEYTYTTKGEYDEDLEEYATVTHKDLVDMEYDFIHVVPPMKACDALINSPLSWQQGNAKGLLECDQYTLQHRRYKNVFGIGDVLGIPKGKTGGSARHHGPIMTQNLISVINGEELSAKFDGYTVCPIKTQYGKIMMAEFDYKGVAPSFPIDPTVQRYSWWAFDIYMLKPMYWYLMLRGLM
jgi:sulfide:quinone oxidoreductase